MEVDVAEVGAPEGKKVARLLLRMANQFLIPWFIIGLLCMCHENLIFHGIKEGYFSWWLRVLNMLCARAMGEHAKGC